MKNQNDLIVVGAVVLVCIGVSLAFFFQKREPVAPQAPVSVVTTDAQPVPANVQYANNLPGGGGNQPGAQGGPGGNFGGPGPGGPGAVGDANTMTPSIQGASAAGG